MGARKNISTLLKYFLINNVAPSMQRFTMGTKRTRNIDLARTREKESLKETRPKS